MGSAAGAPGARAAEVVRRSGTDHQNPDWVETAQREQLIQVANHPIDPASAN
jgi:hypothetical protein